MGKIFKVFGLIIVNFMKFIFYVIYISFYLRVIIFICYCIIVNYYKLVCGVEGRDLFNYIF